MPTIMPTMKTIKQISDQCGMSYEKIRQLWLQRKIVFIKAGNKYLINEEKFRSSKQQGVH